MYLLLALMSAAAVDDVEPLARNAMAAGNIPSLSIAVISGNDIVFEGAFGKSNLWAQTPARPETVYMIGSIFKTMQAVALLQLVEAGKLRLDDPVSGYLDALTIRGEDRERPITVRHLLTHSSGILGQAEKGAFPDAVDAETKRVIPDWDRPFAAYPIWGYVLPPPIEDYLDKGLKAVRPPEERVEYSPMALTLVAHLTEKLSGRAFITYIRERIFEPLEMTSTAFVPSAAMEERFAVPYVYDDASATHRPVARVRVAIWATGQIYGTARDLAKWLIANVEGGVYRGRGLISPELLADAHHIQFPALARQNDDGSRTGYGLAWNVTERGDETFISHSGSLPGETAFVLANVTRQTGVAVLSNGNRAHRHLEELAHEILELLEEE